MKKLLLMAAAIYGVFTIATAIPSAGFYLMLIPAVVGLGLWIHGRSKGGQSGIVRQRTREAVYAVRAGMSYAQASRQFGVPERAIRRHRLHVFHIYFD